MQMDDKSEKYIKWRNKFLDEIASMYKIGFLYDQAYADGFDSGYQACLRDREKINDEQIKCN